MWSLLWRVAWESGEKLAAGTEENPNFIFVSSSKSGFSRLVQAAGFIQSLKQIKIKGSKRFQHEDGENNLRVLG